MRSRRSRGRKRSFGNPSYDLSRTIFWSPAGGADSSARPGPIQSGIGWDISAGRDHLVAVGLELTQNDEFALGAANLDVPRPLALGREDPRRPLRKARGSAIELGEVDFIFGYLEGERQMFVETAVRPIEDFDFLELIDVAQIHPYPGVVLEGRVDAVGVPIAAVGESPFGGRGLGMLAADDGALVQGDVGGRKDGHLEPHEK